MIFENRKGGFDMVNQFSRTELLLGSELVDKLHKSRVAVFGIGGVGGYVVEALARCGLGELDLIDNDVVNVTNINRQIIATHSTVGRLKTEVMRDRISDINPQAKVNIYNCFFMPENASQFPFSNYDYVVDAVDTVTSKLELVLKSKEAGVPVISSMGAGNKLEPTRFKVADIYKTTVCPLARVMRRELKKLGVKDLKVVYSDETPISVSDNIQLNYQDKESVNENLENISNNKSNKRVTASCSFVPSAAGLIIASEVVKDLCSN